MFYKFKEVPAGAQKKAANWQTAQKKNILTLKNEQ